MPAPVPNNGDDLMVVPDGLPADATAPQPPERQHERITVYEDGVRDGDSMRGGYASVKGTTYKHDKLIWIVIAVMTIMCIAVGICSSFITARLMQKGEKPPALNIGGDIQQNISVVVAARKPSIAEVSCGGLNSSGIVMKRDGKNVIVLTNAHAIAQHVAIGSRPRVRFAGYDDYYLSDVLGYDGHYDVAVLSVPVDDELVVYDIDGNDVILLNNDYNEGDYVVSIGNAMSMGVASYDGIVSRKSELLECDELFGVGGKKTVPVFRTTAVINAGMSGGGVFDMEGRLIGLGTYRMSSSVGVNADGGSSNTDVEDTGFATPMSIVYPIYKRILASDGGEVGLLSVTALKSNSAVGKLALSQLGFNCVYENGVLKVDSVSDASSKIKTGDVIAKVGDHTVTPDICGVVGAFLRYHRSGSGKALTLAVKRGGSTVKVTFDGFKYAI